MTQNPAMSIHSDGATIRLYDNLPLTPAVAMRFVKHRYPVHLKVTDSGKGKQNETQKIFIH